MKTRALLPTDLMVLLFRDKSLHNGAKTLNNLIKQESSLSLARNLLGKWIFPGKRQGTWIFLDKGKIQGLVSARSRSGEEVWQIDYLLLTEEKENICLALLNKLSSAGGERGVEKVFLRLPAESPLEQVATTAGFHPYARESLYQLGREKVSRPGAVPSCASSLHPKKAGDDYGIYQLYHLATPLPVRRFEAASFIEWQRSREKNDKQGQELVWEKEGALLSWARVITIGHSGQFEILLHPQQEAGIDSLVAEILTYLKGCSSFLCLAAEFQGKLRSSLQAYGFVEIAQYSLLVKELTVKVLHPYPVPSQA